MSEALPSAEGLLPSVMNERTLTTWLLTHWDGNEIYSQCASVRNCSFSFAASATPVLSFNKTFGSFMDSVPGQEDFGNYSGTPLFVAGDSFALSYDTISQPNSTAFNWSAVNADDIVVSVNNVSLAFDLVVTNQVSADGRKGHSVFLSSVMGTSVPPCDSCSLNVQVEPWGRAVVLDSSFKILPIIEGLSHLTGSSEGGLALTITGRGLNVDGSAVIPEVTIGKSSCAVFYFNNTAISCTTSPYITAADSINLNVSVTVDSVASLCLHPGGCTFQFSNRTSHTPQFHSILPRNGHWPDRVTIKGAGFNATGNVVTIGYRTASVVSATSTEIVVEVPKHVGGTYALSVHVPDKGYAAGFKQWFRFDSGIASVTPKLGSRYGGQRITITGFGFAPFGTNSTASEEDTLYESLFNAWTNYGTANESASFEFTTIEATFDRIVAMTFFETFQHLDGAFEDNWLNSLSVDVAKEDVGYVGPNAYYFISASDGDSGVSRVFDGDPSSVYDGCCAGVDLEIMYIGYSAFLLTDYQILSYYWTVEMPSKWQLWGRETWEADWELVDTMDGPQSEPKTYKFLNRTCDNPGFYLYYKWVFSEWAIARGSRAYTSNGHVIRDINLNPNGFAMHYGVAMDRAESTKSFVPLGATNLAYGKAAFQSSTRSSDHMAENAVDGDLSGSVQFSGYGSCSITQSTSSNSYLVVDLGASAVVDDVVIFSLRNSEWWNKRFTADGGTLVGLSPGWGAALNGSSSDSDASYGVDDDALNTADCWGQGDCDTNENVTICGTASKYAPSSQHHVHCGGAVGRYLFLWQRNPYRQLAVCELAAYGYPYNATTYGAGTPAPSYVPLPAPSAQPSFLPSAMPSWLPSPLPTTISGRPSVTPTSAPSAAPSLVPSAKPSLLPSALPSPLPSSPPTALPTSIPSGSPTPLPSASPSALPTSLPSSSPSSIPSSSPTPAPSMNTWSPSVVPFPAPSVEPTPPPSVHPTLAPTPIPSIMPTALPSALPSELPSSSPSVAPTPQPSPGPTFRPSSLPSAVPSGLPTLSPTLTRASLSPSPTLQPMPLPTQQPFVAVPSSLPIPAPTTQPTPSPAPSQRPIPEPTAGPSQAPTVAPFAPVLGYETIDVKYHVFVSPGRSKNFLSSIVAASSTSTQANGIDWDDAANQCARRGMVLASVRTAGEQSALVSAVAKAVVAEVESAAVDGAQGYSAGAEFDHVWLGAQRTDAKPYWHWRDGRNVWENEYTNWAAGFEYSDSEDDTDYTYQGNAVIAYLCLNAFTMEWEQCEAYTYSVYAYACESRHDSAQGPSYRRLLTSPKITKVSPSHGLPGTVLTVSGEYLDAGVVEDRGASANRSSLEVTLGGTPCSVVSANATLLTCRLAGASDSSTTVGSAHSRGPGVVPVRVATEGFGWAGPSLLPLFTLQHQLVNVTPQAGSLGGGQNITISGVNLPTDFARFEVLLTVTANNTNGTQLRASSPCSARVAAQDGATVVCTTRALSADVMVSLDESENLLTRYALGHGRNASFHNQLTYEASLDLGVKLTMDGDLLRLVSQYEFNNFPDTQRPGIYVVSGGGGGSQHFVESSQLSSTNFRFIIMLFDPFTRTVAAYCATYGIFEGDGDENPCRDAASYVDSLETPSDLISFIKEAPSEYLFVVQTHHWWHHQYNSVLYEALYSCGGSTAIESNLMYYDQRSYLLVGRCNAGLSKGFSAANGIEKKHDTQFVSLELQFDPFNYFDFLLPSASAPLYYAYDEALTPYVEWISRLNGTTAGGTTVQLRGSGFVPNATSVTLAGIPCAVHYDEVSSYRGKHLCEWDGVNCDGLGVSDGGTAITCLTAPWDYSGDAFDQPVVVSVAEKGHAVNAGNVKWSYMNLWSSTTTWGGNDPPIEGDSVVITYGEYIVLDISPPELNLVVVQGTLDFHRDVGDLNFNASYIVLHYGRMIVGTAEDPFATNTATITLVGSRDAYELPVYGAKCIAVRTAELSLHGRPRTPPWTKLGATAHVGNTTLVLREDTEWEAGDRIFVTSTEYSMLQAEERTIIGVSADGRTVELDFPLEYTHWGDGWMSDDGKYEMENYRADVGLLTRNVIVQGDEKFSKQEQFGAQIVLSTETNTDDNPLIGQFSNVEVRQAGQGLKLGKYPIHFHMVGNVSMSYVKNCSVAKSFNRGITVHGVDHLLVEHNVVFDTRGHTIFTEDGTERFNIIRYNLVAVVRPIWSVLLVDQSPSCFWIVNPSNDVYGNVCGGSSHYGFWFRALPEPDGISGQHIADASISRCPNWGELGDVRDNVAHSTGRHGFKISNFFPVAGGYFCPTEATPAPATFRNLTSFKNRHMGVWGEFIMDVSFDGLKFADHVKSGIEFKYINGRDAKFATTLITNSLFVGRMYDEIDTPESTQCAELGNCQGPLPVGDNVHGWYYPNVADKGNLWTHAIHLPGIGSEVEVHNSSFHNYQGALYGCAWCVAHRGGYEMEFWNVSFHNVEHLIHFKHGVAGILIDGDGSLSGHAGGTVVPPTGQWRNNPNCAQEIGGRYTSCASMVRRVNVAVDSFTSPWWDTNTKKHYPLLIAVDITNEHLDEAWDKWNRYRDETRLSCMQDGACGLEHGATPLGAQACFEQAPKFKFSFLAAVGRRYFVTWVDQNYIRATADVQISVTKMKPDELIVLQFCQRPPLYPRLPMRASVAQASVDTWGELDPAFGAWSPPVVHPVFAVPYKDHTGDALADPCAAGAVVTASYSDSCDRGEYQYTGGFAAPQLTADPNISMLGSGSGASAMGVGSPVGHSMALAMAATGRTNNGGQLHPNSGSVFYASSTYGASNALPYMYENLCVEADAMPSLSDEEGVALSWGECGTRFSDQNHLQRFKFGYDWMGNWYDEAFFGKDELWLNALEREADGVTLSSKPVHEQSLRVTLAANPYFCLDACALTLTTTSACTAAWADGYAVEMSLCDQTRSSQEWAFNASSGEIVSMGARAAGLDLCLGWANGVARDGYGIALRTCGSGDFSWDRSFYVETARNTSAHGAFYFDAYRNWNTRGVVQPVDAHNLSTSKELYKTISSVGAAKSYYDYTVWNTSVLSVVLAGNSTLVVETDSCPEEGCQGLSLEITTKATFKWSDNASWLALNASVPCQHEPTATNGNRMCSEAYPCGDNGCADVVIAKGWTVILDVSTPFLNTLTIRGSLIAQHDAVEAIELHSNLVNIKGGRLIIGNATHPYMGPRFQLILHGDMYFHGKECTKPFDEYVSEFGCWKQVIVNGELSVFGKPVEVVSRTLIRDADAGDSMLYLDGNLTGWEVGDEVIVSSTESGGVPEYFTVGAVSGSRLHLGYSNASRTGLGVLASAKIGTTVEIEDEANNLKPTVLDGRATVSLLTRNVEIRGGYDANFDYISGVGPDLTDYGGTIRLWDAWQEDKDGWDDTMSGYELYGINRYPAGEITGLSYVRFRAMGKQWQQEPPFREPPLVMLESSESLSLIGVVLTDPLTGQLWTCTKITDGYKGASKEECSTAAIHVLVTQSIFVGTSVFFNSSLGVSTEVSNNLFFGGDECRSACPTTKMVTLAGHGNLTVVHNKVYGGYGGFRILAPCSTFVAWEDNVAAGNAVGFDLEDEAACGSLFLEGYRNSAGITANAPEMGNFLMVENGVAVTGGKWITWPDAKSNLPDDRLGAGWNLERVYNGTIVGRAPEVAGSARSQSCERWTGGGDHPWHLGHKIGGVLTGFRFFREYAYSGFAAQGPYVVTQGSGYDDLKVRDLVGGETAAMRYLLEDLRFYGFSGEDSCGRKNVALSNEMAGDGEGTARALGASFGKATCYPVEVRGCTFPETPDYARLRFSEGPTTAEVQWALCTVFDPDHSVMAGSSFLDPGVETYFLKSAQAHEWPPEVVRDCQNWAYSSYADDYDGQGTCLWWLRKYDKVRSAITNQELRGQVEAGLSGTQYPDASCEEIFTADGNTLNNNIKLCKNLEYVILKSFIPEKIVSGSEVLYGPVGYVNMYDANYGSSLFAGDGDTSVDIYRDYTDPRGTQMPPMTGKEPNKYSPILGRYTQPYLAHLVNHGYYRIEYTGDITLFDDDFLEYQLVSLTDAPIVNEDYALVIDIKFMKAVKLAFYYNGAKVPASPRRNQVSLTAPAGTNYLDPVSKVVSFVLRGTSKPVRIKHLDVVAVGLGVSVSFSDFFTDNFLDPNAIDSSYSSMVPPTYAANYDPDGGNIVKSNTFVSNLASVLNINPARLRVVNIVPGNRRRRLRELAAENPNKWQYVHESPDPARRRLLDGDDDDDDGLALDFELSALDLCEDVVCGSHGDCNAQGTCVCDSGWAGDSCNITVANCTSSTSASGCSLSSSAERRRRRSLLSSPAANSTISNVTNTSQSTFQELMSKADALVVASSSGTLDTGYIVTELAVSLPDDECGMPGGDSTTCYDACGVINGDNSTCADACGVPNGDGTSCVAVATNWAACDHGVSSTGITSERQTVVLTGAMSGTWQLSYNGATTASVSAFATDDTLSAAINALDTVGSAVVLANVTTASNQATAIVVFVEFSRETGTYPYHLGDLPLIEVVTSSLSGVSTSTVSETCAGVGRTGHTYEEQTVSVSSTSASRAAFQLSMNATGDYAGAFGVTPAISVSATAAEFSTGLEAMVWSGLREGDTFELSNEYFEVFKPDASAAVWTVRFFFAPASDGLLITVLGDVPPLQQHNASAAAAAVTVTEGVRGAVPESAMPISAVANAASVGTEAVAAASVVETTAAEVVEVLHVCGNGLRTTAEGCDDGDLSNGDGCSGNCTVESGFVCSAKLNQLSSCFVPENPTLYFEATSFGPFSEGTSGVARVRRMGYNGSTVTARITVAGSTATSSKSENDDCAVLGDFDNSAHDITLAPGVSYADVEVPIFRDFVWEQALSATERFVVLLASADGADIDSERAQAFVEIADVDPLALELGWCLTVEPTFAPTARPTHVPTHEPTREPTFHPTRLPTVLPTLSLPPSGAPSATPTVTPVPTGPTVQPLLYPTSLPSNEPTHAPSYFPTAAPSEVPTQSHPPSPLPSRPSQEPTVAPSPLWIGVSIKASSAVVFDGFDSLSAFDDDQKRLFKEALVNSVASIASIHDVEVTKVALYTSFRRRLQLNTQPAAEHPHQVHHHRKLAPLKLEVAYTLTVTVEGTADSASVAATLESELMSAYDDGSGTSAFAVALAGASSALNLNTTASLDSALSMAAASSLLVVVVRASSAQPTLLPSKEPTQAPSELPSSMLTPSSNDSNLWGLSSFALVLLLIAGVTVLAQASCVLYRRLQAQPQTKLNSGGDASLAAPAGRAEWEAAASRHLDAAPTTGITASQAKKQRTQVSLERERAALSALRAELADLESRAEARQREELADAEQTDRKIAWNELSPFEKERAEASKNATVLSEREQVLALRRRAMLAATAVERLEAEHVQCEAALAEAQGLPPPSSEPPKPLLPFHKEVNMRGRKVAPLPPLKKKPPKMKRPPTQALAESKSRSHPHDAEEQSSQSPYESSL